MGTDAIEEIVGERFRIDRAPTLLARRSARARIAFSPMRSSRPMRADIAQLCGFVDQSHFTRVFSRSEGYNPRRWRRLHRL